MTSLDKKPRYTISVTDHRTGKRFKLDLFSNYLAPTRNYIVEINGKPSAKVPVASKTKVLDLIRRWLVAH